MLYAAMSLIWKPQQMWLPGSQESFCPIWHRASISATRPAQYRGMCFSIFQNDTIIWALRGIQTGSVNHQHAMQAVASGNVGCKLQGLIGMTSRQSGQYSPEQRLYAGMCVRPTSCAAWARHPGQRLPGMADDGCQLQLPALPLLASAAPPRADIQKAVYLRPLWERACSMRQHAWPSPCRLTVSC